MKLQVQKLPKNNKGDLLIHVDHDPDPELTDENGQPRNRKSFTKSVAQGGVIDVDDFLGAAILAKYPKIVKVYAGETSGGKAPAKDKMSEGAAKTA